MGAGAGHSGGAIALRSNRTGSAEEVLRTRRAIRKHLGALMKPGIVIRYQEHGSAV